MAPSADLTLPFTPRRSAKQSTLQSQVEQIVIQKGAFRNITEDGLQSDIRNGEDTANMDVDDESSEEDEPTVEERLQTLQQTRQTFLDQLAHANNEVLCMLDMISLALWSNAKVATNDPDSSNAARASIAQSTMSPALSADAPQGSLEMRVVQEREPDQNTAQKLGNVSRGWRYQRYEASGKAFSSAADRLGKEAGRQSQYWHQLAELKDGGWPVSRLPTDNHAMVVHFGFSESSPTFRSRGVGILRQTQSGELTIGNTQPHQVKKSLRLRILRDGAETGSASTSSSSSLTGIQQELEAARNALFEDELFYEASREARLIANMGVTADAEAIEIKVTNSMTLCLEYKSSARRSQPHGQTHSDHELASALLFTLKSLLSSEYECAYERRATQSPAPLTLDQRTAPELALLRPLIAELQHNLNQARLLKMLVVYGKPLKQCKLEFASKDIGGPQTSDESFNFQNLREPHSTTIEVAMPSSSTLAVTLNTFLGPPHYGSKFSARSLSADTATVKPLESCSFNEFRNYFELVLARDIGLHVEQKNHSRGSWASAEPLGSNLVLRVNEQPAAALHISCRAGKVLAKFVRRNSKLVSDCEWSAQTKDEPSLDDKLLDWTKDLS